VSSKKPRSDNPQSEQESFIILKPHVPVAFGRSTPIRKVPFKRAERDAK